MIYADNLVDSSVTGSPAFYTLLCTLLGTENYCVGSRQSVMRATIQRGPIETEEYFLTTPSSLSSALRENADDGRDYECAESKLAQGCAPRPNSSPSL
jgi:hypothetical protein